MTRPILSSYRDPVECIWLRALAELGIVLERSREVYASWDGNATLTLADASDFDADDSLAQLIFHELCHLLVAGKQGKQRVDWGLDNTGDSDLVFEHACHRVQAALAGEYGLRDFMAVTTEWRPYWDALPADPLAECPDPALPLARAAYARAQLSPYAEVLKSALSATAAIADVVRTLAGPDVLWANTRARHVTGFLLRKDAVGTCGECAWGYRRAGSQVLRCRQTKTAETAGTVVQKNSPACERFEPHLTDASCEPCGACCHRGFDVVDVSARDPHRKVLLPLLVTDNGRSWLPRPDGRCVLLRGHGSPQDAFRCERYSERPQSCRLFEVGGDACLVARRRVGFREA